VNAWYDTPTKWYPLHIGVGSLLLLTLQWRKRRQQSLEEAEASGELPAARIKGPWQVSHPPRTLASISSDLTSLPLPDRFTPSAYSH
jgi:hypothetical protein